MVGEISSAIRALHVIKLNYPPGIRTVEPHALGYGSDGQILLRAYQTSGASSSGEHEHWKLFRIDRLISLATSDDQFSGPRDGYRRGDRAMKRGIVEQL